MQARAAELTVRHEWQCMPNPVGADYNLDTDSTHYTRNTSRVAEAWTEPWPSW
jgi:hypothetical protein